MEVGGINIEIKLTDNQKKAMEALRDAVHTAI
jgi:hypothetical protein